MARRQIGGVGDSHRRVDEGAVEPLDGKRAQLGRAQSGARGLQLGRGRCLHGDAESDEAALHDASAIGRGRAAGVARLHEVEVGPALGVAHDRQLAGAVVEESAPLVVGVHGQAAHRPRRREVGPRRGRASRGGQHDGGDGDPAVRGHGRGLRRRQ
jgi:hypothetical protein